MSDTVSRECSNCHEKYYDRYFSVFDICPICLHADSLTRLERHLEWEKKMEAKTAPPKCLMCKERTPAFAGYCSGCILKTMERQQPFNLTQITMPEMLSMMLKDVKGIPTFIAFDEDGRCFVYPHAYRIKVK